MEKVEKREKTNDTALLIQFSAVVTIEVPVKCLGGLLHMLWQHVYGLNATLRVCLESSRYRRCQHPSPLRYEMQR